ncbi:hypothetical protein D3C74_474230 [compost metagenome]
MVDAPFSFAQDSDSIVSGVSPEYEMAKATSPSDSVDAEVICICGSAKAVQFTPIRISFW